MAAESAKPTCGIVMPISELDGCPEDHWTDVLAILIEAIKAAGFEGELVSNADDVGIIQKRIIQNLYDNPVVVCDVSGKNANVMFELGLRLAFDKPTIIVKDDKTSYSFDTSAIEHLAYPRDLRFNLIVEFKERLSEKIKATYRRSVDDPAYTTFLKNFGEFKVAKLDKKEVSGQEFIIEELKNIRSAVARLDRVDRHQEHQENLLMRHLGSHVGGEVLAYELRRNIAESELRKMIQRLREMPGVIRAFYRSSDDFSQVMIEVGPGADKGRIRNYIRKCDLNIRPKEGKSAVNTGDPGD